MSLSYIHIYLSLYIDIYFLSYINIYDIINKRVDIMVKEGLIDEVKALYNQKI